MLELVKLGRTQFHMPLNQLSVSTCWCSWPVRLGLQCQLLGNGRRTFNQIGPGLLCKSSAIVLVISFIQ